MRDLRGGASAVVAELLDVGGERRDLRGELVDALLAGAARGLVARRHHRPQIERVVQRLERQHRDHRRAVGVRDDPVVGVERLGVDLGDDERDRGVLAKGARVVDDDRAGIDEALRPLARARRAGGEERDVEALDVLVVERRDGQAAVQHAADRAL